MIRPALRLSLVAMLLAGPATARDRHEHATPSRLFISPMGEPFRTALDGDPETAWFAGADADGDGRISLAEFQADAGRWFGIADRAHDGEIDPDDVEWYETRLVPEIRVPDAPRSAAKPDAGNQRQRGHGGGGGRGGGGMGGGGRAGSGRRSGDQAGADRDPGDRPAPALRQGAARYSYLDFPEPLTSADANMNRGVDQGEMMRAAADRFAQLDKNHDGFLERRELPRVDTRTSGAGVRPAGHRPDEPPPADPDRQLGGGDREQD